MGVIELIGKGFGIATRSMNLVLFLFAFGFLWNLINIPLSAQARQANLSAALAIFVLSIFFFLLSIFFQAGALGFVRDSIKTGQASLKIFLESARRYFLRVLGISLIVGLFILILGILAALSLVGIGQNPNPLSILIAVLLALAGLLGVIFVFLAPYILVSDDARVIESMRSSFRVVGSHFWKIVFLGILLILIGLGIGAVMGLLFGILDGILPGVASQIVFGLISSLVNSYLGVVVIAVYMSYYLGIKAPSPGTSQA